MILFSLNFHPFPFYTQINIIFVKQLWDKCSDSKGTTSKVGEATDALFGETNLFWHLVAPGRLCDSVVSAALDLALIAMLFFGRGGAYLDKFTGAYLQEIARGYSGTSKWYCILHPLKLHNSLG